MISKFIQKNPIHIVSELISQKFENLNISIEILLFSYYMQWFTLQRSYWPPFNWSFIKNTDNYSIEILKSIKIMIIENHIETK